MFTSPRVPPVVPDAPRVDATPRLAPTLHNSQKSPFGRFWRTVALVCSTGATDRRFTSGLTAILAVVVAVCAGAAWRVGADLATVAGVTSGAVIFAAVFHQGLTGDRLFLDVPIADVPVASPDPTNADADESRRR